MRKNAALAMMALLLLAGTSSAAGWQLLAGAAIVTSACVLGLVFVFGEGFGVEEAKIIAREEFYQVIVAVLLVVGFGTFLAAADQMSAAFSDGTSKNLQALASKNLDTFHSDLASDANEVQGIANKAASAAAQSGTCNIFGVSASFSGCGGFAVLLPMASMASTALAAGLAEMQALKMLLLLGNSYAITMLLPFGIFLRTFKFTRGAGGLLIALGISFYMVLPLAISFMGYMFAEMEKSGADVTKKPTMPSIGCEPFAAGAEYGGAGVEMAADAAKTKDYISSGGIEENEAKAIDVLSAFSGSSMQYYLYRVLIKATLTTIVAVMATIMAAQRLSALAGAEVDLSALTRIA